MTFGTKASSGDGASMSSVLVTCHWPSRVNSTSVASPHSRSISDTSLECISHILTTIIHLWPSGIMVRLSPLTQLWQGRRQRSPQQGCSIPRWGCPGQRQVCHHISTVQKKVTPYTHCTIRISNVNKSE